MPLTRRELLSAAVFVTAGGALQVTLACKPEIGDEMRVTIEFSSHFSHLGAIHRVGREAHKALGQPLGELLQHVAPERGTLALQQEIDRQYLAGDTIDVHGWPLALTEARIYALVAHAPRTA